MCVYVRYILKWLAYTMYDTTIPIDYNIILLILLYNNVLTYCIVDDSTYLPISSANSEQVIGKIGIIYL